MWQSIWDISITILFEFWLNLSGLWQALKFYFNSDDQQEVRKWLVEYLPRVPGDFAESWRDGILLSILLNKLQPGCYPGANELDADYALCNLYRVFQLLEYHFNITPKCTVEEIITCSNGSDSKLLELLLQLKNETDTKADEGKSIYHIIESEVEKSESSATSTNCVARGTGLMVGFVGRAANFIVFFASMSDLDLVVEIKGPCDTICTERITKKSPKKKQIFKPWKPTSPYNVARSSSNEDRSLYHNKKDLIIENEDDTRYMPLEYEIHSNRIYFAYMPLMKGHHQIKIIAQGMHVSDSPYTVAVGSAVGAHKNAESLKSSLKAENHTESKNVFVRFQDPSERKERLGKIIKRRVLRYIVKIDNKDIVVDTDSIDNLATSLLKMDYEFQKPPLSRRNSWGFVGDAERKVSVIRQFCVNMDELEAQSVKLHRSHSLSGNSKRVFNRSGSCEDIHQQKKLETVTEGTVSHFETNAFGNPEAEAALVFFNADFENSGEYSENDRECFDTFNKQISDPKCKGDSTDFIEATSFVNDFVDDHNLFYRRNAEATLNAMKDKTEIFTQMSNFNSQPLDLLPGASEISGRHLDQINQVPNRFEIMNNFEINSSDLNENESQEDLVQDIKSTFGKTEYMSLTEAIRLAEENSNERDSIFVKTNESYEKLVSKQKDMESLEENDMFDDVFIEEELCTKVDIRTVDQTFQKSVNISDNDPKSNSEKPINNSNSIECLDNPEEYYTEAKTEILNRNKTLKEPLGIRRSRRCHYKKIFPNPKMYKKIKENQRNSNKKSNRPLFNFSSDFNQRSNNSKHVEEYNEIRSKLVKDNTKIENFSVSSNKNNVQMRNSDKLHCLHDLEDSLFPYSQKRFQRNHSKFLVNNLKTENKSNCLDIKIDAANVKKITPEFSKVVKLPYCGKINFNNKVSLNNHHSGELDIEMSSLSQVNELTSENNLQQNSSNKTAPTSVAFCQLNFRHFNPTLPNKRTSLVRNRISQWEKTVFKEDLSPESKNNNQPVSKPVNITSRLNFWETFTKENKHQKEFHKMENRKSKDVQENITDTTQLISTGITGFNIGDNNNSLPQTSTLTTSNFGKTLSHLNESEFSNSPKTLHHKFSSSSTFHKTQRSSSDPGILEVCTQDELFTLQEESTPKPGHKASNTKTDPQTSSRESMSQTAQQTSSAEYPSSSSIFLDYSDEDEESSADVLDSTEDEYIDDEISESASAYWGDLSLMENLKVADENEYRDLCRIVDGDSWRHENKDFVPPCAVECQVFGIATYFGYVAVKNRFQVLTKGAGCGNLSATVQGFGRHDVSQVTVRYAQKDVYEVTYQVMSPGLYLISVRWMENPIVGSPFLCKVTF